MNTAQDIKEITEYLSSLIIRVNKLEDKVDALENEVIELTSKIVS